MKVLCLYRPSGPAPVAEGWRKVFESIGMTWRYWYPEQNSAFDIFQEYRPDIFVSTTWDVSPAIIKCVQRFPCKVALYASTWGDLADTIDLEKYPIVAAKDGEKKLVEQMKKATGEPSFVWLHTTPRFTEAVIGGWENVGVRPLGIQNAADVYQYHGGESREEYSSDCTFVGGWWGYKSGLLGPYLIPLMHEDHPAKLRCRVWGNQRWPVACYSGLLPEGEAKHAFASATVCPSIGEPHSLFFSDIVERYYKCPVAGGFVIGGPEVGLDENFGDAVPCGKTPAEYQQLIVHYANNPLDRIPLLLKQQQVIWDLHTYHDRAITVLEALDLPGEAVKVIDEKARVRRLVEC